MMRWKGTALWAGVFACVGIVGWGLGHRNEAPVRAGTGEIVATSSSRPALRVPALTTPRAPQRIALDASLARRALHDGELRVTLADGDSYPVRIERQETDAHGHWSLVGRVQTPFGAQPMVLTFGGDAVFGVLPTPDGRTMQVTTGPGGVVSIAPSGGMVPEGKPGLDVAPDFLVPPRDPSPEPPRAVVDGVRPDARGRTRLVGDAPISVVTPVISTAAAPPETTPVQIDVLAFYSPDLVTKRGSVSAVQTEMANLFAVANQSHVDSGSRVRLNAVGVQQLAVPDTDTNSKILNDMSYGRVPGVDLEAMRDSYGADLVTLVRPYHDFDGSCGIAWLGGAELARSSNLAATYAYSVVDVDPCWANTLAHELAHLMGSMHDRGTATSYEGDLSHGAYVYSFGRATPEFATIMAYAHGQPSIPFFSNPASTRCAGQPCGLPDDTDNVQSLNRMAPSIAAFRGPPNTLSIADVEMLEAADGTRTGWVPIRLSAKAPVGGVTVQVSVTGGTATPGVDYTTPYASSIVIEEGQREATFAFEVLADDAIEPDETVLLHIATSSGYAIHDADAVVTIANDDPRPSVKGRVVFPANVTPPATSFDLTVTGIGDNPWSSAVLRVAPPDFRYSIPASPGAPLVIQPSMAATFVTPRARFNEVLRDTAYDLRAERGVVVTGRLRAPPGMALPTGPVQLTLRDGVVNHMVEHPVAVSPPDFSYSWRVVTGGALHVMMPDALPVAGNAKPFLPYSYYLFDLRQDTTFDVQLSTLPTLRWCCGNWSMEAPTSEYHGYFFVSAYLSAPAPVGGTTFHYRLVDGTAHAGEDFDAESGTVTIPEGQQFVQFSAPHPGRRQARRVGIFRLRGRPGLRRFAARDPDPHVDRRVPQDGRCIAPGSGAVTGCRWR